MSRKPTSKEYWPGGVLLVPRMLIRSEAYKDLTPGARALLLELQDVWKPSEPIIHFSVRRAGKALKTSPATAGRLFDELNNHGFITLANESDWLNGKAREWTLNWKPQGKRQPSNEWLIWTLKNEDNVSNG